MSDDHNKLVAQRRDKLRQLRERTDIAFPNDFRRSHLAAELHAKYAELDNDELAGAAVAVRVAGRMMAKRVMGKASFIQLHDLSGEIQLFIQRDNVGEAIYQNFKSFDIGDILGAGGELFITKTGELSLRVRELRLLTKSLRPLPEKYHGIADTETRYRQRYVDLIMSVDTRRRFRLRSSVISYIREFMERRDFLEVETPMMHPIPGGAAARPFVTHHNALDLDLYLRIAPELYLKRLVVGGFERVFEINRNFRNEGLSTRHNPEFTMLEFYQAFADYTELMDLTEELLRSLVDELLGATQLTYQGELLDFGTPFKRVTMLEAIVEHNPQLDAEQLGDLHSLRAAAGALGIDYSDRDGTGKLQTAIFEQTVEQQLRNPTFVTAYPTEVSPLSRRNDDDPAITDRFELFIAGREIANGFSELNDPEDQAERFREQVEQLNAGDREAMHFDHDYIRALEYGLAPTAGEGIGIDRLVMLLSDTASIRDVLLFPHLRPEREGAKIAAGDSESSE